MSGRELEWIRGHLTGLASLATSVADELGGEIAAVAELVEVLGDLSLPLMVLAALPNDHESGITKVNAVRAVNELVKENLLGWIFVDNSRLAQAHGDVSLDRYYAEINKVISEPRAEMAPTAPRIEAVVIPKDKIGEIIGPKGKMIREIEETTGATLEIEDDGTVRIGATDGPSLEAAKERVMQIAFPPEAEVGKEYEGEVVNITSFGAFVNILPGRDGLLHISKIGGGKRIDKVEDVYSLGDKVTVVVREIDRNGKVSLDIPGNESSSDDKGGDKSGDRGGDRGGDRKPRGDGGGRDRNRSGGNRDRGGRGGDRKPRERSEDKSDSNGDSKPGRTVVSFEDEFDG